MAVICSNSKTETTMKSVDALWVLFQGQTKAVRKAFIERLCMNIEDSKTHQQEEYVRTTLMSAINEVRKAKKSGKTLQAADDFLKELRCK